MLNILEEFSIDIGIQFGLDECSILNIIRWQIQPSGYDIESHQNIEAKSTTAVYKYLGVK